LQLGALLGAAAALAATLVLVVAISAGPAYSDHSYASIVHPIDDRSYQERIYKWNAVWRDADQHPFGQGLGTAGRTAVFEARFLTIAYYDVDNSYLKIALDQGIFGLVLFAAALLTLLTGLIRRSLATDDQQRAALGAAGAGALAAFMVVMGTGNYIEGLPAFSAWLFAGLGLAQFATVSAYARDKRSDAGSTS
jgi:O-antigen ligase